MGLAKALIVPEQSKIPPITVLFNPEEYTLNRENNFASQAVPGLGSPLLQFVHGNLRTLEMELFFDTSEPPRDVRKETNKIVALLEIDSDLHAPPVLNVVWSSLFFRCVLARVNQKFIRFQEDGTPIRARLSVTFNEYIDADEEILTINPQTADFSKVHVVSADDTLSGIAAQFYENAALWRPIAMANGIDDPRSISPGQSLRVPPLPFTDPGSGEVVQ